MKAVTRFESEDGEVYDSEEDANFADLVWRFHGNLFDETAQEIREKAANEVQLRVAYNSYSTRLTYFLKWVQQERHAFTEFLEATKDAD